MYKSSSYGASPQLTTAQGKFTLIFADKPNSNLVRIYASKHGYEVVNEEELKKAAVLGRKEPLKVVMCKEGQVYQNQIAYYKIAEDATQADYKKKLAILKQEGKAKDQLLRDIQKSFKVEINSMAQANELLLQQLHTSQTILKELTDQSLSLNLDDQSETYQKAFQAFAKKDINLALQLLDRVDLEKRLASNTEAKNKEEAKVQELQASISQRDAEIKQDINQCLFKARLLLVKSNFALAEEQYRLALKYAPQQENVLYAYALFLRKQHRFSEAIQLYEEALSRQQALVGKEPTTNQAYLAHLLNELAINYTQNEQIPKAFENYSKAIQIYKKLVQENPNLYRLDLAKTYNNLGDLYRQENQVEQARVHFEKALALFHGLTELEDQASLTTVFNTRLQLAMLQMEQQEFSSAKTYLEDAALNQQQLSKRYPTKYRFLEAKLNQTKAVYFQKKEAWSKVIEASNLAIKLYKKLISTQAQDYLIPLVRSYSLSAYAFYKTNDLNQAQSAYEESLQLLKQAVTSISNNYKIDIVKTSINLATIYQAQLVETTFVSYKEQGLDLVEAANDELQSLSIALETKEQLQNSLDQLRSNFESFTEEQEQLLEIKKLKEGNQNETVLEDKVFGQEIVVARLEFLVSEYPDNPRLSKMLAIEYNDLAWLQIRPSAI